MYYIDFENINSSSTEDKLNIEATIPLKSTSNGKTLLFKISSKNLYGQDAQNELKTIELVPRIWTQTPKLIFLQVSHIREQVRLKANKEDEFRGTFNNNNQYAKCVSTELYIIDTERSVYQISKTIMPQDIGLDWGVAAPLNQTTIAVTGLQQPINSQSDLNSATLHQKDEHLPPMRIQSTITVYYLAQRIIPIDKAIANLESKEIEQKKAGNSKTKNTILKEQQLYDEIQIVQIRLAVIRRNPKLFAQRLSEFKYRVSVLGGELPYASTVIGIGEVYDLVVHEKDIQYVNNGYLQDYEESGLQTTYSSQVFKEWSFFNYITATQIGYDENITMTYVNTMNDFIPKMLNNSRFKQTSEYLYYLANVRDQSAQIASIVNKSQDNADTESRVVCHFPLNACVLRTPPQLEELYNNSAYCTSYIINNLSQSDEVDKQPKATDTLNQNILIGCPHNITVDEYTQSSLSDKINGLFRDKYFNYNTNQTTGSVGYELSYLGSMIGGVDHSDSETRTWSKSTYQINSTDKNATYMFANMNKNGLSWDLTNHDNLCSSDTVVYGAYLLRVKKKVEQPKEDKEDTMEVENTTEEICDTHIICFQDSLFDSNNNNSSSLQLRNLELLTGSLLIKRSDITQVIQALKDNNKNENEKSNIMYSLNSHLLRNYFKTKFVIGTANTGYNEPILPLLDTYKTIRYKNFQAQNLNPVHKAVQTMPANMVYKGKLNVKHWSTNKTSKFKMNQQSLILHSRILTEIPCLDIQVLNGTVIKPALHILNLVGFSYQPDGIITNDKLSELTLLKNQLIYVCTDYNRQTADTQYTLCLPYSKIISNIKLSENTVTQVLSSSDYSHNEEEEIE